MHLAPLAMATAIQPLHRWMSPEIAGPVLAPASIVYRLLPTITVKARFTSATAFKASASDGW
jgi:hypothetical protein